MDEGGAGNGDTTGLNPGQRSQRRPALATRRALFPSDEALPAWLCTLPMLGVAFLAMTLRCSGLAGVATFAPRLPWAVLLRAQVLHLIAIRMAQ